MTTPEQMRQKAEKAWVQASLMSNSSQSIEIIKEALQAARQAGIEEAAELADIEARKEGLQGAMDRTASPAKLGMHSLEVNKWQQIAKQIRNLNNDGKE